MELTNRIINKKLRTTWANVVHRCTNKNDKRFNYYKNKGLDKNWLKFENFSLDLKRELIYHIIKHGIENTTIDRINNALGYSKENCRWATWEVQRENSTNKAKPKIILTCKNCDKEFVKKRGEFFCSRNCFNLHRKKISVSGNPLRKKLYNQRIRLKYLQDENFRKGVKIHQKKYFAKLKLLRQNNPQIQLEYLKKNLETVRKHRLKNKLAKRY